MASSVYTRQLGLALGDAPGDVLMFTADDRAVYVVRDVIWIDKTGETQQGQIYLEDPGNNQYPLVRELAAPPLTPLLWQGRQVIPPNWRLFAYGSGPLWTAVATGYEFVL